MFFSKLNVLFDFLNIDGIALQLNISDLKPGCYIIQIKGEKEAENIGCIKK